MHVVCFFSDTDLVNEKKRPKNKVFLCLSFIPLTLKRFIVVKCLKVTCHVHGLFPGKQYK